MCAGCFRPDACQDDRRGFVEQPAQMPVAAPRDMTVIVDLSGLVAARCQADPGSDGARVPEVGRVSRYI